MVNVVVHGSPQNDSTQKVVMLLEQLSLKYTLNTENPDMPPFGNVVVYYGDRVLFGENTIMRYIAQNNKDLGDFLIDVETEMWLEVSATHFKNIAESLLSESENERDNQNSSDSTEDLQNLLEKYETRLSEHNYIGGDHLTIADISHIPLLQKLLRKGYKETFRPYKNVYKWLKRLLK